jgi:hypothetical protein
MLPGWPKVSYVQDAFAGLDVGVNPHNDLGAMQMANETSHRGIGTPEGTCAWSGCGNKSEAALDGYRLCRNHFYQRATKRLEEYRAGLRQVSPGMADHNATLKFISEVISQTTTLVANAKLLAPAQRDQFLNLSLSAAELYKQAQRNARIRRNMPILVYREKDSKGMRELTNTVDVSKQGVCIVTVRLWEIGEKIWIEKPASQVRTLARVAWLKKGELTQFLMGLDILDSEDFWGLDLASSKK